MNTKQKIKVTRAASAAILIAFVVVMMLYTERLQSQEIVTANPPLSYIYSDAGLTQQVMPQDYAEDIYFIIRDAETKYEIDKDFIEFCAADANINPDGRFLISTANRLQIFGYSDDMWEALTGYTFSVLYDIYSGSVNSEEITVLGDIYSQRKTTVMITSGEIDSYTLSADIASAAESSGVKLSGDESDGVRYIISGGLKLSICVGENTELAAEAKSKSDVLIAYISDSAYAELMIDAGADVVIVDCDTDTVIEYYKENPIVYGLGDFGGEDPAYITAALTVGMKPILRFYPCTVDGGVTELITGDGLAAALEEVNSRSGSSVIDENNKVNEKRETVVD